MNATMAAAADQIAAQVGAEREQGRGACDVAHGLREQRVHPVAGCHLESPWKDR